MAFSRRTVIGACLTFSLFLVLLLSHSTRIYLPATTPRPATSKRSLRILPIGDSITYGLGSSTQNGYRLDFEQDLAKLGYNITMEGTQTSGTMEGGNNRHEGYPLATIQEIHGHIQPILAHDVFVNPDFVLLFAGTNNVGFKQEAPQIITDLTKLLDDIFSALPDTCIVLSQIVECICGGDMPRVLAEYNSKMQDLASTYIQQGRRLVLVDQDNVRMLEGDAEDLVHPNDRGYTLMAGNFVRGVEEGIEKGFVRV